MENNFGQLYPVYGQTTLRSIILGATLTMAAAVLEEEAKGHVDLCQQALGLHQGPQLLAWCTS